ncbi:glycosyl hydrolase family 76-domain-containing protein [Abortiporus biennis]|nr:glycosyl hydrolase family 76-domain-containing protein [Abortiporus biennis]
MLLYHLHAIITLGAFFWNRISAQNADFSIPSGWRKPTSTSTLSVRQELAQAVIDSLTSPSNVANALFYPQTASLLCAIAVHDLIVGNTSNEDFTANNLQSTYQAHPGYYQQARLNSESTVWALAAIQAYRVYKQKNLLDIATFVWNQTNQYMITSQNAANGSHPSKAIPIQSTCNGATTAGGVLYWVDVTNDTDVNAETTGSFMALSAYLYEATNQQQFSDAAELSAQFIKNQLYDGTVILDTVTLNNCAVRSAATTTFTYNSGFFIQGLSVHASTTNNPSWTTFLNTLIASTIKFPTWTSSNGVNTERSSPTPLTSNDFTIALKGIFIRGLYEAWTRSPSNSDVANLIQSYITVQFNALLDLATVPNSNMYSASWPGPPDSQLTAWGQLAAMDVLSSVIGFVPPSPNKSPNGTSSPSSTTTPTPSILSLSPSKVTTSPPPSSIITSSSSLPPLSPTTTGSRHSASIGLIVGIAVGAILIIVFIVISIIYIRRRGAHNTESQENPLRDQDLHTLMPFVASPEQTDMSQGTLVNSFMTDLLATKEDTDSDLESSPESNTSLPTILPQTDNINHPPLPSSNINSPRSTPSPLQLSPRLTQHLSSPPSYSGLGVSEPVPVTVDNPEAIPDLIQRVHVALANLQAATAAMPAALDDEAPPQYEEEDHTRNP